MTPRIVLAGAVGSSERTLQALRRHGAEVVGVLGLDASRSEGVSDYRRLDGLAAEIGAEYADFIDINDAGTLATLRRWAPDHLFVVGLSQMVTDHVRSVPRVTSIGFHPTELPVGRGRAPIAWLVLDAAPGAATFFVLGREADSGDILAQEPFEVADGASAADVLAQALDAVDRALDRWLPELLAGAWDPKPQDHAKATFYGRRAPADGLVRWERSAEEIVRLVRATGRPHPGAYTYLGTARLRVWAAEVKSLPVRGVAGRVVTSTDDGDPVVQCADGLVALTETELEGEPGPVSLRIGTKLGVALEDVVVDLQRRVDALESALRTQP